MKTDELKSLPNFLTIKQVADILCVSVKLVYKMKDMGVLRAIGIEGTYRIDRDSLISYLESAMIQPKPVPEVPKRTRPRPLGRKRGRVAAKK